MVLVEIKGTNDYFRHGDYGCEIKLHEEFLMEFINSSSFEGFYGYARNKSSRDIRNLMPRRIEAIKVLFSKLKGFPAPKVLKTWKTGGRVHYSAIAEVSQEYIKTWNHLRNSTTYLPRFYQRRLFWYDAVPGTGSCRSYLTIDLLKVDDLKRYIDKKLEYTETEKEIRIWVPRDSIGKVIGSQGGFLKALQGHFKKKVTVEALPDD